MPLFAAGLVQIFHFPRTVEIALVALAISPVPPLLPKKQAKAGGEVSYGLGLMAILALVSIVAVPAALEILERVSGRQLSMAPGAVARVVLTAALAPLAAGVAFRAVLPATAKRIEKPVSRIGAVLMPLTVLALLFRALPTVWGLLGGGTALAMVIFVVAGLAIGHFLGGPDPDHSVVLALSTACRHPAIALSIAATNFPDLNFVATILLYLIVNTLVGIPYLKWQERRAARAG